MDIKKIADTINALFGLAAALSLFAPKNFESSSIIWSIHYLKNFSPEIFIYLLIYFGVSFHKNIFNLFLKEKITENSENADTRLKKLILTVAVLGGITIFFLGIIDSAQTYSLLRTRYVYLFKIVPMKLEHELKGKAAYYESMHQLNKSLKYYKMCLNEFPDSDAKLINKKITELEEKIKFSDAYYNQANIDSDTKEFSKDRFFMLYASARINPENSNVIELIKSKANYLKSLASKAEEFHSLLCKNDLFRAEAVLNDYGWYLIEDKETPFFDKGNIKKVKEFVCAFETEKYVSYINRSWAIDQILIFSEWAQKIKKDAELESIIVKY